MSWKTKLLLARRKILAVLVPEWFWPKSVQLGGVDIPVRHEPFSFGTKWILAQKAYEGPEIELVTSILKGGEKVVEMGSSIGVVTRIISKAIGEKGKVIAVECNKELYQSAMRWQSQFPNLELLWGYGFPVGKIPNGTKINRYSTALGSLGTQIGFGDAVSTDTIPDAPLIDLSYVEQVHGLVPTVMVIDVEGAEAMILAPGFYLPTTIQHLVMECHGGLYPNGLMDQENIIKAILGQGFRIASQVAATYHFIRS